MHIKRPRDITLRNLPNIESPFAAAPKAAHQARQLGSPLRWDRSLVQDSPFAPTLSDHEAIARLESKLQQGTLVLVHDITDGKPFSPLVSWKDGDHLPGRWHVEKRIAGLNLESHVARLNDWQITPEQISHLGPGGVGHLSATSFDSDLRAREIERQARAKQDAPNNLELPVGAAAAVAPLVAAASDGSAKEEGKKELHIEVGIFLDGTLNDASNIEEFKKKLEQECIAPRRRGEIDDGECRHRLALMMGSSYSNGRTNVSKLFDLYRPRLEESDNETLHSIRVYKNGVGTTTSGEDSLWSSATGLGSSGIPEQVESALEDAAVAIARASAGNTIANLTIDLFGFSRGSAAARHAVSELSKEKNGIFAKLLNQRHIAWPAKVSIRFVGLFDTVAGVVNILRGDFSASNDRTDPVNIFLNPDKVERAVHITAADECRENFALNSLFNPDGSIPKNFREISLPGVHSDIGGGYHDEQDEHVLLSRKRVISDSRAEQPKHTMDWDNLESLKMATLKQGWIGENCIQSMPEKIPSLEINETSDIHPTPYGRVTLTLDMRRRLKGEYSRIGLNLMHALASQAGVTLDNIDESDPDYSLPDELIPIHQSFSEQIRSGSNAPSLSRNDALLVKQKYIHHSDNFNSIEFLVGDIAAELEIPWDVLLPFMPAENRIRIVHPNRANKI